MQGCFLGRVAIQKRGNVCCSGLETYQLLENRQGMKLTNQFLHPVKWWRYSHEARVLMLGTGDIGLWLQVTLLV